MQALIDHSNMPAPVMVENPRRKSNFWERVCADCTIAQMETIRDGYQAKLDHPHKRATERALTINTAAVAGISAEIARRMAEGRQLRALPCTYRPRPMRDEIDAGLAMIRETRARWNRQQMRLVR